MEDRIADEHANRLTELERGHRELTAAVSKIANSSDSRREHIDYRFNAMNEQLKEESDRSGKRFDKLDNNTGKLVWLFVAALVAGVAQFIIQGGLRVVP